MIEDFRKRLLSLDIETTGLDETKDRIWSVGISGDRPEEIFMNPTRNRSGSSAIEEMAKKDSFQASQMAQGSFQGLKSAIDSGSDINERSALSKIASRINKDSIILIQNVNFENKFLGEAFNRHGISLDDMAYRTESPRVEGRYLYTPPQATTLRNLASWKFSEFQKGRVGFDEITKTYEDLMDTYRAHFANTGKGAITVELMDITKSTYAMAAGKNLLSKDYLNVGTNVDFLSRVLLGEGESHTALSDAKQQEKIFTRLLEIQSEIKSDNMSERTLKEISAIKAGQPFEATRQFLASIKNTLDEIETTTTDAGPGKTRIFDPSIHRLKHLPAESIDVIGPGGARFGLTVPDYGKSITTSNPQAAIDNVVRRFKNIETPGINKEGFAKALEEESLSEKIFKADAEVKKVKKTVDRRISEDIGQQKVDHISRATESIDQARAKIGTQWSQISSKNKKIGFGLASAAFMGGILLSDDEDKAKELKKNREKRADKQKLDSALKAYTHQDLGLYHGSGFADWNERKGHHGY